jgi:fucose permease
MVVYLQDVRAMSESASNSFLALFFGLLMAGRFVGGFVVKRLGYLRAIMISSLLAVLCVLFGVFTPYAVFIPLTGFFFSIIFPTITAAVSDERTENINTILGVLFTFSGLGGVIGPWLAGWVGDFYGLQAGMGVILILSASTFFFIVILNQRNKHGQST